MLQATIAASRHKYEKNMNSIYALFMMANFEFLNVTYQSEFHLLARVIRIGRYLFGRYDAATDATVRYITNTVTLVTYILELINRKENHIAWYHRAYLLITMLSAQLLTPA